MSSKFGNGCFDSDSGYGFGSGFGSGGGESVLAPPPRIEGVRAALRRLDDGSPCLVVQFGVPCAALSSGVVGGGFLADCSAVVNRQVLKSYMSDDPEAELQSLLARNGFDRYGTLGFMTAAYVSDVGFAEHEIGSGTGRYAAVWATVGLGNAARAGRLREPSGGLFPGTINIVAVVDGDLAPGAFVGAAVVAAEAKASALAELGARDPDDGGAATGTTTDALAIVATGRGAPSRYAGTATHVGHAVGRAVYDAVLAAGRRYAARAR
ncbi:adenosylcobinamide amidohydrolase [Paenibacillus sp.]|uniref:adenosylcobinamide amidohydrolase n=1 Tax=Paenibacillus sp. TaxID=58172 RepID=UPI002D35DDC8|nr:adenosylcobinamide amidohydrolase [Paenibacillus sp.]HZG88020.1 adenosylcobinamide amidohydrolase [Paenibacillus sp.]